jgi:hypothetical protein
MITFLNQAGMQTGPSHRNRVWIMNAPPTISLPFMQPYAHQDLTMTAGNIAGHIGHDPVPHDVTEQIAPPGASHGHLVLAGQSYGEFMQL